MALEREAVRRRKQPSPDGGSRVLEAVLVERKRRRETLERGDVASRVMENNPAGVLVSLLLVLILFFLFTILMLSFSSFHDAIYFHLWFLIFKFFYMLIHHYYVPQNENEIENQNHNTNPQQIQIVNYYLLKILNTAVNILYFLIAMIIQHYHRDPKFSLFAAFSAYTLVAGFLTVMVIRSCFDLGHIEFYSTMICPFLTTYMQEEKPHIVSLITSYIMIFLLSFDGMAFWLGRKGWSWLKKYLVKGDSTTELQTYDRPFIKYD